MFTVGQTLLISVWCQRKFIFIIASINYNAFLLSFLKMWHLDTGQWMRHEDMRRLVRASYLDSQVSPLLWHESAQWSSNPWLALLRLPL